MKVIKLIMVRQLVLFGIASKKYSPIINPIVTSSGNPMRSLIVISLSFRMTGAIFSASGRLIQNPAPPVANQNWAWWPAVCNKKVKKMNYYWRLRNDLSNMTACAHRTQFDFKWWSDTRFSQIPERWRIILAEQKTQLLNVHIIVIIEMTKPSKTNNH